MTDQLWVTLFDDPKWLFLFLAIAQAHLIAYLYSSYTILWLNSFVASGAVSDNKEVEMIFSRMTLYAIPGVLATIFAMGYLADVVKPLYLIVPAFLSRGLTTFLFKFVKDPQGFTAYALTTMMFVTTVVMVISTEALFFKILPRDIRGAMTILLSFFLQLGAMLYNMVGGRLFDSMGPASPFVLIAIFDVAICVYAIVLGCFGHLNIAEVEDGDKN